MTRRNPKLERVDKYIKCHTYIHSAFIGLFVQMGLRHKTFISALQGCERT